MKELATVSKDAAARAALKSSCPPCTYSEVSSAPCNPGGTCRRFSSPGGISAKAARDAISSGFKTRRGPKPQNSGSRPEHYAEATEGPLLQVAALHPFPLDLRATAAWCLPTEAWAPRISEPARPSRSFQHRLPRSPAPRAATGSRSHVVVSSCRGRAHRAPAPACQAPSLLLPSGLDETPPTALLSLR